MSGPAVSQLMLQALPSRTSIARRGFTLVEMLVVVGIITLIVGMVVEVVAMRRLYGRDHLDHVLGTFGLIEMAAFIVILTLGLVYAWRKGVLRWA